jgi:acyl-CoA synthetase (NDP forming)
MSSGEIDPRVVARLLRPQSVALVGAAEEPHTMGGRVFNNLLRAQFAGSIHLVSRTRMEIGGRPCVRSIDDLPPGVDALVLIVPAEAVRESIAACVRRNVNGAIIFSSGFAETGPQGKAEQEEIIALARDGGLAIVGPNCLGFTNYVDRIPLTFDEYRPQSAPARPGVALIAQSGGLVGAIRDSLVGSGVAVTYAISTGNEAVLTTEDFLQQVVEDDATGTILIFAEQVRRPRKLLQLAARARARNKPIVLMQPGRTEQARKAAQSHTGALSGDLAMMRVALGREGVAVVDSFDALVDVTTILNRYPIPTLPGAAVLTNSGAMRGVAFDIAAQVGLELVEFSPATTAALRALVPPFMPTDNPFDIATLTFRQPDLWETVTRLVLDEPKAGVFVMTLFPGALQQQADRIKYLLPVLQPTQKPSVLVMLGDPLPLEEGFVARCRAEGIPLLRSTERAMRAMASVVQVGQSLHRKRRAPLPNVRSIRGAKPGPMAEYRSKTLLEEFGVPMPKRMLAADLAQAEKVADAIGYPVVLKAQAAALFHKSDAGGVIVGIGDAEELRAAWRRMLADVRRARPDLKLDGILVEAMAKPGLEMIVGARRDPDWGVVAMVGLGGIWVETLRDVQLLPPGADEDAIVAALKNLRGAPLLEGARGTKAIDLSAVARVAAILSDVVEQSSDVAEVEINPLVCYSGTEGVLALDALIVVRSAE